MTSKEPSGTPLPSPGGPLPSPVTPCSSHVPPRPTPPSGSEGPAPAELCPHPRTKALSPSQCRRHHALQCLCADVFTAVSPGTSRTQPFGTRAQWCGRRFVHRQWAWRVVSGAQAYYLYCALHFWVIATSAPRDWGPLTWTMASGRESLFTPFTIFVVPDTQLLSDKTPGA